MRPRALPVLLLLPLAACAPSRPPADARPDLLVVMIDDVSDRDLDEVLDMPFLEGLGERGLRFRRAYAHPSCSPSRYALYFGRYAYRGGVGGVLRIGDGPGADVTAPSVADALRGAGYRTGLIGKWHLSATRDAAAIQEAVRETGFDDWRAGVAYGSDSYYSWQRMEDGRLSEETAYETEVQTDSFLRWWREASAPRFCVLSYQALHTPYEEPPSGRKGYERSSKGNWLAMAAHLDGELERVLAGVDLERTTVIVFADNGTSPGVGLYERGRTKPTVYEGGVHVPLFALGYGVEARGETPALVGVVDIGATLLDLAGVERPAGGLEDSRSFRGTLVTGGPARELLYTQRYKPDFGPRELEEEAALAADGTKLIRFLDGHEEAYDVLKDPFEQTPLDPEAPGLAPLRALLDELGG